MQAPPGARLARTGSGVADYPEGTPRWSCTARAASRLRGVRPLQRQVVGRRPLADRPAGVRAPVQSAAGQGGGASGPGTGGSPARGHTPPQHAPRLGESLPQAGIAGRDHHQPTAGRIAAVDFALSAREIASRLPSLPGCAALRCGDHHHIGSAQRGSRSISPSRAIPISSTTARCSAPARQQGGPALPHHLFSLRGWPAPAQVVPGQARNQFAVVVFAGPTGHRQHGDGQTRRQRQAVLGRPPGVVNDPGQQVPAAASGAGAAPPGRALGPKPLRLDQEGVRHRSDFPHQRRTIAMATCQACGCRCRPAQALASRLGRSTADRGATQEGFRAHLAAIAFWVVFRVSSMIHCFVHKGGSSQASPLWSAPVPGLSLAPGPWIVRARVPPVAGASRPREGLVNPSLKRQSPASPSGGPRFGCDDSVPGGRGSAAGASKRTIFQGQLGAENQRLPPILLQRVLGPVGSASVVCSAVLGIGRDPNGLIEGSKMGLFRGRNSTGCQRAQANFKLLDSGLAGFAVFCCGEKAGF